MTDLDGPLIPAASPHGNVTSDVMRMTVIVAHTPVRSAEEINPLPLNISGHV
jgi:hypothetical protein